MLQAVFEVYPVVNGHGVVKFAWQKSAGNYLAITGSVITINVRVSIRDSWLAVNTPCVPGGGIQGA